MSQEVTAMTRKILWTAALAVAAACSGSGNLAVSARSGAVTTPSGPSGATGPAASAAVTVDQIRIVIRKIDLEKAGGGEVELKPLVVKVSGSTPIHEVYDTSVDTGDYRELDFVVGTVPAEKSGGNADLAAMTALHASIAVDGSVAGTGGGTFEFTTPMEVAQKREGTFHVGSGTSNLTFDVDPSGWFAGAGGAVLDPRDPTNRGEILANIRKSIRLFPDDARHGTDEDDCECHEDSTSSGSGHDVASPADHGSTDGGAGTGGGDDGHHDITCACVPAGGTGADGGMPADGGVPTDGGPVAR